MGQVIYTTGEVAKLLNVSPRTVAKWMDSGKLKGHRIPMSAHRRILKNDLQEFINENKIPFNLETDDAFTRDSERFAR